MVWTWRVDRVMGGRVEERSVRDWWFGGAPIAVGEVGEEEERR